MAFLSDLVVLLMLFFVGLPVYFDCFTLLDYTSFKLYVSDPHISLIQTLYHC